MRALPSSAFIPGACERSRAPFSLRHRLWRVAVASLAGLAVVGCAGPTLASTDQVVAELSPIEAFQNREARLYAIGYRLAAANAPYCDRTEATLGFLLHDIRAYGQPDAIRAILGLTGDIGVQAIAPDSPASEAGLRQNDTLLVIDGTPLEDDADKTKNWQRAAALQAAIAASGEDGNVALRWRNKAGEEYAAAIPAVRTCASTFELLSDDAGAAADGKRVLVGAEFPGFAYPDDELAAALAHEMAHNLLGHIDYLARAGKGDNRGRNSERDADRLMPWLLANAGYDPSAASRMMRKYGPRYGGGLLRDRSHDGWDERVELIEAEVAKIRELGQKNGSTSADWRTLFTPLLDQSPD